MVGLLMHVWTALLTCLNSIAFAQFAWDFVSIPYNIFNCVYGPLISLLTKYLHCSPWLILWPIRYLPASKKKRSFPKLSKSPWCSSYLREWNYDIEVQCEYRPEAFGTKSPRNARIWRPRPRLTRCRPFRTSEDYINSEREWGQPRADKYIFRPGIS